VVSRAQLRDAGLSRDLVDHWLRVACLQALHRGVYALGHAALRREGRWLAAVLAYGEGAVLTHRSAAAHWGLLASDQARVDVTAPRSREQRPGIRLHRTRFLDARDTTTHEAIPITTVARTLLDLAATVRAEQLERAFAQALALRIYDHAAITDVLHTANGHRGTRALAAATAREPKHTKSDWEARMLELIRRARLPEPFANHTLIALGDADIKRRRADRARDAALHAAGYTVLRFTWRTNDHTIERRLRATLTQRRDRAR
jgi:hypothetical protein